MRVVQFIIDLFTSARFVVDGDSMLPTVASGESVLAVRPRYRWNRLRRGDIVVLRHPAGNSEKYIKRIKALEDLANSYKGVVQSYALQAGREVRIIVKPEDIDDLEAARMSRDIAKQIEETMQYPGQIKVTVLRETRSVDFAK